LDFNLLGYVIMDNHYHLIIETKEKPLHKIMQKVNNRYSKNYNKRHNRTDHVFGGRYKGILVEDDKYFMDQKEPVIKAKAFYEEVDIIGESEKETSVSNKQDIGDKTLDGILRHVVANEDVFRRIKLGSRQRILKDYKIRYVKVAVDYGYSFKEIGENIGVTGEAVNKIVQ
jgi:hypothetical protein